MAVTVNCEQLPQGKRAVTSLQRRFPDLRIQTSSTEEHCSLSGPYSQVQQAVAHILQLHESKSGDKGSTRSKEQNRPIPNAQSQLQQTRSEPNGFPSPLPAQTLGLFATGREGENLGAEGGVLTLPENDLLLLSTQEGLKSEAEVNDLFLIMDSDLFQYLRRCEEYQRILRDHDIEVVDETNQGLTTLFFQARSKVTAASGRTESEATGRTLKHLAGAQKELRKLQQSQEVSLRKDQVSKRAVHPQGGLPKTLNNIQSLLPKLLLNQDEEYVYIVGESSDVSQAKQLLLLGVHNEPEDVGASAPSPSRSPLQPLSSASSPSDVSQGERLEPRPPTEDARLGKMLRTSGKDSKTEYKLAARFKSSGVSGLGLGLGSRPGDLTSDLKDQRDREVLFARNGATSGSSSTSAATEDGALVGAAGIDFRAISPPERTREDVLFRSSDLQPPAVVSLPNSHTPFTVPPTQTAFDVNTLPTAGLPSVSGTGLKRANSFSGRSRRKPEEEHKGATGPVTVPTLRRSNSVTSIVHSAEVTVPQLMWSHMKEAYSTRLDDMMSDLQMSERQSENCTKVVLKGAESSVVASCQKELEKLVAMVTSDFTIMELRLSDLGVAEGDEVFDACCVDLRARFRKVSQRLVEGILYLIGPKLLCTQVNAALREVFSGETRQNDLFMNLGASSQDALGYNITAQSHLSCTSDAERNTNRKTDPRREEKVSSHHRTTENTVRMKFNNTRTVENITEGLSQLVVKKDPVVREKVERSGSISGRTSKKYASSLSPSAHTNQEPVAQWLDEKSSPSPVTVSKRPESVKQTNLHSSPLKASCLLCQGSLPSQSLTVCGLSLCAQCFSQHGHCKRCFKKGSERERVPQDQKKPELTKAGQDQASAVKEKEPGIRGTMNIVELQFSLAGHVRDTTAKITYLIPDGIQDERHPYPGSPFRGGFFEAYLPLSTRGKSLLPCLKRAFQHGLTFTISPSSKVVWHNIPHKTKMEGGKSGNGYPDSSYLNRLSEALKVHGIEDVPASVTVEKNRP